MIFLNTEINKSPEMAREMNFYVFPSFLSAFWAWGNNYINVCVFGEDQDFRLLFPSIRNPLSFSPSLY